MRCGRARPYKGNRYGSQGWDLYSNHKIPAGWILVYGNIHSEEPEAPIRREIMKLYRTHIKFKIKRMKKRNCLKK